MHSTHCITRIQCLKIFKLTIFSKPLIIIIQRCNLQSPLVHISLLYNLYYNYTAIRLNYVLLLYRIIMAIAIYNHNFLPNLKKTSFMVRSVVVAINEQSVHINDHDTGFILGIRPPTRLFVKILRQFSSDEATGNTKLEAYGGYLGRRRQLTLMLKSREYS